MMEQPLARSQGKVENTNPKFNAGDLVHLIEVAAILVSIGMNYQKFEQIATDVGQHGQALTRIEHYLSSQDPQYWRKTHQDGDR